MCVCVCVCVCVYERTHTQKKKHKKDFLAHECDDWLIVCLKLARVGLNVYEYAVER